MKLRSSGRNGLSGLTGMGRFIWNRLRRLSWSDWLFLAVILFVLATRGPAWVDSWRQQGGVAAHATLIDVRGDTMEFPPANGPGVVVFWATWCGPCEVELGRLARSVSEGKIDPEKIYAISFGEDMSLVKKISAERGYPFRILVDSTGALVRAFKVAATPTVVFLENGDKISWVSEGLSPTLVFRAERHIAAVGSKAM